MSQTIYSDSFTPGPITDPFGDGPLFTAPLDIEKTTSLDYPRAALAPFLDPAGATPGYRYGLVQDVEVCYARVSSTFNHSSLCMTSVPTSCCCFRPRSPAR